MENEYVWNYCVSCHRDTKHVILFSKALEEDEGLVSINNQIVECRGCGQVSFRQEVFDSWNVEYDEDGNSSIIPEINTYPSSIKGHSLLHSSYLLPEKIKDVYLQTILAMKGRSNLLAGVGFRAVIEAICLEEQIKGSNLGDKINNLLKKRLITDREAERLHSIRFLGNDAVHEMEIPKIDTLALVLSIVEHLLENLYLIDRRTKELLDTIVKSYADFEVLLWKCAENLSPNEEKSLKDILGKHIRRINVDITSLEETVIEKINSKQLEFLKLGRMENESTPSQLYLFTGLQYDDGLPF